MHVTIDHSDLSLSRLLNLQKCILTYPCTEKGLNSDKAKYFIPSFLWQNILKVTLYSGLKKWSYVLRNQFDPTLLKIPH